MAVAGVVVALTYHVYFDRDLFPPIVQVYAKTIQAGVDPGLIGKLLLWAVPGAIIQAIGGPKRQMGILLATGTLIVNPIAGWTVLAGIVLRLAYRRWKGAEAEAADDHRRGRFHRRRRALGLRQQPRQNQILIGNVLIGDPQIWHGAKFSPCMTCSTTRPRPETR